MTDAAPARIAVFGGVYSNYLALGEAIADARRRGAEEVYCLGDLGAFGPYPNRTIEMLIENDVRVVQGNYDNSIGRGLEHCQCGYASPRDNHFAAISYAYTFAKTDPKWRGWLAELPVSLRVALGGSRVLMCHGSPRRVNEFLWESTTSTGFLEKLAADHDADVILATHTGIKWRRDLAGGRMFVNVGVLGRPENDGRTNVWYVMLSSGGGGIEAEFVAVDYDYERLASEMRTEGLPDEFIETVLTGWWTTCVDVLPGKERSRGRF